MIRPESKTLITPEYQKELFDLHTKELWGNTGGKYVGDSVVKILEANPEIKTILDYGCGAATLKKFVEDRGITDKQWTLYDPAVKIYDKEPTGKFDLVISTDVLEHVEEIMLNNVIRNLQSLTGKFLLSEIACYLCNCKFENGPYVGQDMHISLKAPDGWRLRLEHPDFEDIESISYVIDYWKVRYFLLQARVK